MSLPTPPTMTQSIVMLVGECVSGDLAFCAVDGARFTAADIAREVEGASPYGAEYIAALFTVLRRLLSRDIPHEETHDVPPAGPASTLRDALAEVIRRAVGPDRVLFHCSDGKFRRDDMIGEIRAGSDLGREYGADLMRVCRDWLARGAKGGVGVVGCLPVRHRDIQEASFARDCAVIDAAAAFTEPDFDRMLAMIRVVDESTGHSDAALHRKLEVLKAALADREDSVQPDVFRGRVHQEQ